jgi:hypothetical protein
MAKEEMLVFIEERKEERESMQNSEAICATKLLELLRELTNNE